VFNLTLDWVRKQLEEGKCAVTGISFQFPDYAPGTRGKRAAWTPSVDRIDNTKGYTTDNCRLVVWIYNLAKNNYADEDVAHLAQSLISRIRQEDTKSSAQGAEYVHA